MRCEKPSSRFSSKKVAAGRGFAQINSPAIQPVAERTGALRWAALIVVLMGLALGGYYLVASGWLAKAKWGGTFHTTTQPPVAVNSGNPGSAQAPNPSPGTTATTQSPAPPVTPAPAVAPGAVSPPLVNPARESPRPVTAPNTPPASAPPAAVPKPATPAPPLQGDIAVTANLLGANISVDGRSDPTWVTPHMIKDLSPGEHRLVVSKPGFHEARQTVTVEAGKAITINVTLAPPRGEIAIATNPPGAEVLIDGKSYGPGPIRAEVDAGPHAFLVKQAGRLPVEGKVVVQDQAVVQRTIDLPPKPSTTPELNIKVSSDPSAARIYADGAPVSGSTPTSFPLLSRPPHPDYYGGGPAPSGARSMSPKMASSPSTWHSPGSSLPRPLTQGTLVRESSVN